MIRFWLWCWRQGRRAGDRIADRLFGVRQKPRQPRSPEEIRAEIHELLMECQRAVSNPGVLSELMGDKIPPGAERAAQLLVNLSDEAREVLEKASAMVSAKQRPS